MHTGRTDADTHAQSTCACRCSVAMVKLEVVHFIGKGVSRVCRDSAGGHERSCSYRHRHRHKHRHKHMLKVRHRHRHPHTHTDTHTRMLRSEQVGGSMCRVTLQGCRGGRG